MNKIRFPHTNHVMPGKLPFYRHADEKIAGNDFITYFYSLI